MACTIRPRVSDDGRGTGGRRTEFGQFGTQFGHRDTEFAALVIRSPPCQHGTAKAMWRRRSATPLVAMLRARPTPGRATISLPAHLKGTANDAVMSRMLAAPRADRSSRQAYTAAGTDPTPPSTMKLLALFLLTACSESPSASLTPGAACPRAPRGALPWRFHVRQLLPGAARLVPGLGRDQILPRQGGVLCRVREHLQPRVAGRDVCSGSRRLRGPRAATPLHAAAATAGTTACGSTRWAGAATRRRAGAPAARTLSMFCRRGVNDSEAASETLRTHAGIVYI